MSTSNTRPLVDIATGFSIMASASALEVLPRLVTEEAAGLSEEHYEKLVFKVIRSLKTKDCPISERRRLLQRVINYHKSDLKGDQPRAYDKLLSWVANREEGSFFQLRGYAGSGKCRDGSTTVLSSEGLLTLRELFNDHATVRLHDIGSDIEVSAKKGLKVNSPKALTRVSHIYAQRVLSTIRVTTDNSPRLKGTYNHPVQVLTSNGPEWKQLGNLEINDAIIGYKKNVAWTGSSVTLLKFVPPINTNGLLTAYTTPASLTPELSRLLGYLVADAYITRGRFDIQTDNPRVLADLRHCITECFPDVPVHITRKGKTTYVSVRSKWIGSWLYQACGFSTLKSACTSKHKQIPRVVRQAPLSLVQDFLGAYLSCDSEFTRHDLKLCSASEKLIRQLVSLLSVFGCTPSRVRASLSHAKNGSKIKRVYYSAVYTGREVLPVLDTLTIRKGFARFDCKQDQRKLPQVCVNAWNTITSAFVTVKNVTYVRLETGETVPCHRNDLRKGIAKSRAGKGNSSSLTRRVLQGLNWELAKRIDSKATRVLKFACKETVWLAPVTAIERIDKPLTVYDVCVPEPHAFLADGLVNHNTHLARKLPDIQMVAQAIGGEQYTNEYCAPTHKAKNVLSKSLNRPTKTIYSFLKLKMEEGESEERELVESGGKDTILASQNVMVMCDEMSMLPERVVTCLRKKTKLYDLRSLMMGDPAQLNPVGEDFSSAFELPGPKVMLREILRSDNTLVQLSVQVRANDYAFKETDDIHLCRSAAFGKAVLQNYDPETSRVIAWRNRTVNSYNAMIRKHLGRGDDIEADDIVALGSPILSEYGKQIIANTDDEFLVSSVQPQIATFNANFKDVVATQDGLILPGPADQNVPALKVKRIELDELSQDVFMPEDMDAFQAMLSKMADLCRAGRFHWKQFWAIKNAFTPLRFAYALTAHRSQGSTYDRVFVDVPDILANSDEREAQACLYVAATRPSQDIFLRV